MSHWSKDPILSATAFCYQQQLWKAEVFIIVKLQTTDFRSDLHPKLGEPVTYFKPHKTLLIFNNFFFFFSSVQLVPYSENQVFSLYAPSRLCTAMQR